MKKTTQCSMANLMLLLGLWIALAATAGQMLQGQALWLRGLVALLAVPICGYVVQNGLSPLINRLIGGAAAVAASTARSARFAFFDEADEADKPLLTPSGDPTPHRKRGGKKRGERKTARR